MPVVVAVALILCAVAFRIGELLLFRNSSMKNDLDAEGNLYWARLVLADTGCRWLLVLEATGVIKSTIDSSVEVSIDPVVSSLVSVILLCKHTEVDFGQWFRVRVVLSVELPCGNSELLTL